MVYKVSYARGIECKYIIANPSTSLQGMSRTFTGHGLSIFPEWLKDKSCMHIHLIAGSLDFVLTIDHHSRYVKDRLYAVQPPINILFQPRSHNTLVARIGCSSASKAAAGRLLHQTAIPWMTRSRRFHATLRVRGRYLAPTLSTRSRAIIPD